MTDGINGFAAPKAHESIKHFGTSEKCTSAFNKLIASHHYNYAVSLREEIAIRALRALVDVFASLWSLGFRIELYREVYNCNHRFIARPFCGLCSRSSMFVVDPWHRRHGPVPEFLVTLNGDSLP